MFGRQYLKFGLMPECVSDRRGTLSAEAAYFGLAGPRSPWKASTMRNVSNAFRVSITREEIALVFGSRQQRKDGEEALPVLATSQVILSPFAAKRLLASLVKILGEFEAAYGPIGGAAGPDDRIAPPILHPTAFQLPLSTRMAVQLLELLQELGGGADFERSFKLLPESLLTNRLLLAVRKQAIPGNAEARVLDLCRRLGMPEAGLGLFREQIPEADVVGFGLEEENTVCLVKAYLEFRCRYAEAIREKRDKAYSYVSHLGVKWDASDAARNVLGQYTCFPALTASDILERIAASHYSSDKEGPLATIRDVVALAVSRVGQDKFLYLEATEESTPRSSFDINVYPANLRMREFQRFLPALFRYFAIPDAQSRSLSETVQVGMLGHLAGGTDRRGRAFLTVSFEE